MTVRHPEFDMEALAAIVKKECKVTNVPVLVKQTKPCVGSVPLSIMHDTSKTTLTMRCMKPRLAKVEPHFFTNAMEADEFYYPSHLR